MTMKKSLEANKVNQTAVIAVVFLSLNQILMIQLV